MANILSSPCDEGIILSQAKPAPCAKSAEPWILTATILGSSLAFIDGTVVNVALPALQTGLDATVIDVQWVIEAYALFLSALLLVGGSLGDRFGRKLIFGIGVALFALASVWCGLASNILQLILARAIQGVGGALLVPGSLAIISASFREERRGEAIGTWSGFTSITAAIGPLIGGWMIDHLSWRAAFFINIPIAAAVLIIVFWRLPESRGQSESQKLDWFGALLATVGIGLGVYGLIESSRLGFGDLRVIIALAVGVVLIAAFVFVESRISNPMLPLHLFRSKNFTGTNLLTLFLYAALGGALFFYPMNLIQIQGYSSTAAGASFLPFVIIMFLLSRWSGGLVKRFGARLPLIIGPCIAGLGFGLFILPGTGSKYWTSFFPAITVLGLGMSIAVAPLTTTVMNSVRQSEAGTASGINNAVSRVAGLLAVAIFGILMLHTFIHHLDQRLIRNHIDAESRDAIKREKVKLATIEIPPNLKPDEKRNVHTDIQESFVAGFRLVFLISAGLAFASAIASWLMIQPKGT